jgi:hypothetical protein
MVTVMNEPDPDLLSHLWDDFTGMPFPRGFYRREPEGECMVSLDMSLAGCISVALDRPLDDWRRGVLQRKTATLERILSSIGDDAYGSEYFTHLHRMAVPAAELDRGRGESSGRPARSGPDG